MKTLNPNTKKARAFIEAYNTSTNRILEHIYGRCSQQKRFAWRDYYNKCYYKNGYDLRIISYNTFQFTCAWKVENNLRVETRNNSYIIPNAF